MAKAHPMGVGAKCYLPNYPAFDTSRGKFCSHRSVHSSHFQVLAEIGFLGAAVWIALHVVAVSLLRSVLARSRSPALAADSCLSPARPARDGDRRHTPG